MTISEAIKALEKLKATHGDVKVYADCAFCGKSTAVDIVAPEPMTIRLQGEVRGDRP